MLTTWRDDNSLAVPLESIAVLNVKGGTEYWLS